MDKLKIVFVVMLCCQMTICAFEFPSKESITEIFEELKTKITSKKRERPKRQSTDIRDESTLPYEARSSELPQWPNGSINLRYMPTLGNGYIGTTVYSDKIFLNGLFTGEGSESHRAAIPSVLVSRIKFSNPKIEKDSTRKYIYNALEGYFMESIKSDYAYFEQKFYLHQKYIRLYVVEINYAFSPVNTSWGYLSLNYPEVVSNDITFENPVPYIGNWLLKGRTKIGERGEPGRTVSIFYQWPIQQILIAGSQNKANYTFLMAVDTIEENARSEFDRGQLELLKGDYSNYDFFMGHVKAWKEIWNNGRVELEGANNNLLIKATWFAQSYIYNSLPPENPDLPPPYGNVYYVCGRTSIGKGEYGKDYQGHVMWDNEHYILPAVLPFHPQMAKQMLRYRYFMGKAASQIAKDMGAPGFHYPWESAYSGFEVSPEKCPSGDQNCLKKRLFTTSGVALAIRYFVSMTIDWEFLVSTIYGGCDMLIEVTDFLASQLQFNNESRCFELPDATGPDLFHPGVKNNAFLMASISLAIRYGRYLSCVCQRNERVDVPDETLMKAFNLNLPYDMQRQLYYQFEGFDTVKNKTIMQDDTIMLGHPLNWNYTLDIMRNDMNYYDTFTDPKTTAMTLSFATIGWKRIKENQRMTTTFAKSYQDYTIQPFRIWTEYTEKNEADQAKGNVNFLPGMGGFLQSLIYGFGGLKIRPDYLEFNEPMPPPGHEKMTFHNLHYLNNNLTIVIETSKVTIMVNKIHPNHQLLLKIKGSTANETALDQIGKSVSVGPPISDFYIYQVRKETCELPNDYIYMPFGCNSLVDQPKNNTGFIHSCNWFKTYFFLWGLTFYTSF